MSWKGLLSVIDGGAEPKVINAKAVAVQRLPDMQDLADAVQRTSYERDRAIAAHEQALKEWREAKAERGLE